MAMAESASISGADTPSPPKLLFDVVEAEPVDKDGTGSGFFFSEMRDRRSEGAIGATGMLSSSDSGSELCRELSDSWSSSSDSLLRFAGDSASRIRSSEVSSLRLDMTVGGGGARS